LKTRPILADILNNSQGNLATAEGWSKENGNRKPACVYFKTGSESENSLKQVREKGFSVFGRKQLLEVLSEHSSVSNAIFQDFLHRIKHIEEQYQAFRTTPIGSWTSECWVGFYQELERLEVIDNWGLVNSTSGSFWNAVLNWPYWKGYPFYMQIEQGRIAFKLSTDGKGLSKEDKKLIRNEAFNFLINQGKDAGLNEIHKPARFAVGNYMTVAQIDEEVWLGEKGSIVDIEGVIGRIAKYKLFQEEVASKGDEI
jgi:hypothetical protein